MAIEPSRWIVTLSPHTARPPQVGVGRGAKTGLTVLMFKVEVDKTSGYKKGQHAQLDVEVPAWFLRLNDRDTILEV